MIFWVSGNEKVKSIISLKKGYYIDGKKNEIVILWVSPGL